MDRIVIGTDEVGRGCLAGPVVAAAVILPSDLPPWTNEIKDSKLVSPKKRAELANKIAEQCVWSIKEVSAVQIDKINILQASLLAMREAVRDVYFRLPSQDSVLVLIDGNHKIPNLDLPVEQQAVVDGDNLHKAIGAASIVAKVYRDLQMYMLDSLYPQYGFGKHKGYGTAEHREAIMVHGPCSLHRKTFRGVYEYVKSSEAI